MICQKCGIVIEDKIVEQDMVSTSDADGNLERHHEAGSLGTDINETASKLLCKYTNNNIARHTTNKYIEYTERRLRHIIKTYFQFENLNALLRDTVIRNVSEYVRIKKIAKESIKETKTLRKVRNKKTNSIRYPEIDNIIKDTIIKFCSENPKYGDNVNLDAIELHNHVTYKKNGVKLGTPRGNYNPRYPGLEENKCTKHGGFAENSHYKHYMEMHLGKGENISYPGYQKTYIPGFREWLRLKLHKPDRFATKVNKIRDSEKCEICGVVIKYIKNTTKKIQKNGEKKRYEYLHRYHLIRVGNTTVKSKVCPGRKKLPAVVSIIMIGLGLGITMMMMFAIRLIYPIQSMHIDLQIIWLGSIAIAILVVGCVLLGGFVRLIRSVVKILWRKISSAKLNKTTRRFLRRFRKLEKSLADASRAWLVKTLHLD